MSEDSEIERLRRENHSLIQDKRRLDDEWRRNDELWKAKMDSRWTSIEGEMQKNRADSSSMRTKVDDMRDTLYGIDHRSPGMVVEVDRLKQTSAAHKWMIRALIGAALAAFGTWLAEIVFGKK